VTAIEKGVVMKHPEAVAAFSALGHEHRLAIYRLLVEAGPDGLSAGVIASKLDIPPSSLTFHTQALVRAGLVTQQRESRLLIYAADFSSMNSLVAYLTENCCGKTRSCPPVCNSEDVTIAPVSKRRSRV
jgi:ArsR family transcriptional regulator